MTSSQRHKQGSLTVGVTDRANGRKIDTWTFRPGDVGGRRERENEIVFEVSLLKTMEFTVDTKGIPKERFTQLKGAVLGELREQALAAAQAEFDLKNDLVWSDWLEIRVQEASASDQRDVERIAQASVSYAQIPRAETADGTAYTVNGNGLLVSFPEPTGVYREQREDGWITGSRRPTPEQEAKVREETPENSSHRIIGLLNAFDRRSADTQFSYLPDTPETRAGLDAIIQAIDGVNQRLQEFLHPEQITQTLQRAVASNQLLLGGPQEPPAKSRGPKP